MFGINHKITDAGLYILSDILDEQIIKLEKKLAEIPIEDDIQTQQIESQIEYFVIKQENFKAAIDKQLEEKFQFSIEEVFKLYGQYEHKFINIEFHKFSKSSIQYGRQLSGTIIYNKSERQSLEEITNKENLQRTDGLIKFQSSDKHLSEQQREELLQQGFRSSDIYEILATNFPTTKAFGKIGKKEIPNTIEIKINPNGFDLNQSNLWLLSQKIKKGHAMTENDWLKFCGLSFYLIPESEQIESIKQVGFNIDGTKKDLARYYELDAKLYDCNITKSEIQEFKQFLNDRKTLRIKQIENEIKKSTNKKLNEFKDEYPDIYMNLNRSRVEYEDETLAYFNLKIPIFWDYAGFLHIYLRHCSELAIEGHFEDKTKFQYSYKDIQRILKIAIEQNLPQINQRLSQGKDFRIYGDKSLYFNGNYYALHILNNGRVAAFHPLENPEN